MPGQEMTHTIGWAETLLQLGVSGVFGLLILAAIRYVGPKLLDHVTASIQLITESHNTAILQLTAAVDRILADNKMSRDHCESHIRDLREECSEFRQHSQAMHESAWRYIRQQGEQFEHLCDALNSK